jgi:chromosome segregation ATPase
LTTTIPVGNLCPMSRFVRTVGFRIRERGLAPALDELRAVDDRLRQLDARMDELHGRMQLLSGRLDDLDHKLDRLDGLEGGLDKMSGDLDGRLSELQDLLQVVLARSAASSERAITILEGAARNARRLDELEQALGAR